MPTPTYTPLATISITSATSSVTFSNISQDYTDLQLSFSISTATESPLKMYFNGDTSSIYAFSTWWQQGYLQSGVTICNVGTFSRVSGNLVVPQYTYTDRYKTYWGRAGQGGSNTNTYLVSCTGAYRTGTAISSIRFDLSGQFAAGSVFTLYGTVR